MEAPRPNAQLDVLDEAECRRLLATGTVGRLGVVLDGKPEIFPVNFALSGQDVVIRTDQGSKLSAALSGPVVFEVDDLNEADRSGWSVVVHGNARLERDREGLPGSQNRVLRPWRGAHLRHRLRVNVTTITGRRVGDGPSDQRLTSGFVADL